MQLKKASILVVDDEPVLLSLMSEWFQQIAGHVFGAANGVQALEILGAHNIDLIVTDLRMPVMDGITLLKKIKANGSHTRGVIFITGFADLEAREAYDLGARHFWKSQSCTTNWLTLCSGACLTRMSAGESRSIHQLIPSYAAVLRAWLRLSESIGLPLAGAVSAWRPAGSWWRDRLASN